MSEKKTPFAGGEVYWAYNLPLQIYPIHEDPDDETTPIVDHEILNYMARRSRCTEILLTGDAMSGEPVDLGAYCERAARVLENLADQFRKYGRGEINIVYYPDSGMSDE